MSASAQLCVCVCVWMSRSCSFSLCVFVFLHIFHSVITTWPGLCITAHTWSYACMLESPSSLCRSAKYTRRNLRCGSSPKKSHATQCGHFPINPQLLSEMVLGNLPWKAAAKCIPFSIARARTHTRLQRCCHLTRSSFKSTSFFFKDHLLSIIFTYCFSHKS